MLFLLGALVADEPAGFVPRDPRDVGDLVHLFGRQGEHVQRDRGVLLDSQGPALEHSGSHQRPIVDVYRSAKRFCSQAIPLSLNRRSRRVREEPGWRFFISVMKAITVSSDTGVRA
ncbi:hypothetical protein SHIRM173S_05085 [Streptomyces hirsutus]